MPTYKLISGDVLEYDASPELADFLARAQVAAADPTVSVADMVELLYGEGNPLLVRGVIPGRGFVTPEVLANPAYRIMLDLLDQKRIQAGSLDLAASEAAHTVSVSEAAKRLGISTGAVRQAIAAGRLPAVKRGGQYWLQPEAVASYRVSRKGPDAAEVRSPVLQVRLGTEGDAVMQLRHDGQLRSPRSEVGSRVLEGELHSWTRALVKSARKDMGTVRLFVLRPGQVENKLRVGVGLYVIGRFDVVDKVNETKAAVRAWKDSRETLAGE